MSKFDNQYFTELNTELCEFRTSEQYVMTSKDVEVYERAYAREGELFGKGLSNLTGEEFVEFEEARDIRFQYSFYNYPDDY